MTLDTTTMWVIAAGVVGILAVALISLAVQNIREAEQHDAERN